MKMCAGLCIIESRDGPVKGASLQNSVMVMFSVEGMYWACFHSFEHHFKEVSTGFYSTDDGCKQDEIQTSTAK